MPLSKTFAEKARHAAVCFYHRHEAAAKCKSLKKKIKEYRELMYADVELAVFDVVLEREPDVSIDRAENKKLVARGEGERLIDEGPGEDEAAFSSYGLAAEVVLGEAEEPSSRRDLLQLAYRY